jgi:uncharacterized protein
MSATLTRPAAPVVVATARGRHLVLLLAAAFTGPWLVWGSAIAQAHDVIGWRLPQGIALWTLTPSLLVAVLAIGGRVGLRELAGRLVRVRACGRWYALALATPPLVGAGAVGLVTLAGGPTQVGVTLGLPAALLYLVYGTGLFLFTEEAVWRGALLPRLQARLAPLPAALVLGVVWSLWHLPLLSVPGAGDEGLPFLPFAVCVMATSVLIAALVNAAGGSVVVAAVFHASFDAAYSYAGVVGTEHAVLWAAAGLTTVAGTVVAVITRGRLGVALPA